MFGNIRIKIIMYLSYGEKLYYYKTQFTTDYYKKKDSENPKNYFWLALNSLLTLLIIKAGSIVNMDNRLAVHKAIKKHQVWIFFVLTLVIALITSQLIFQMNLDVYNSVTGFLVYLLYILSPAIMAAILLALLSGGKDLLSLLKGLARWKVGVQWYLVAIIMVVIVEGLTTAIFIITGNNIPERYTLAPLSLNVTIYIIISAIGLAIGLGYAFSVLLKNYGPIVSAAITGIFLVIYKGFISIHDPNIIIMSVGLFTLAFLLVWLYYYTKRSILIMAIFLAVYVYMSNMLTFGIASDSGTVLPIVINKIIYILITLAIIVLDMNFFFEKRPLSGDGMADKADS